MFVCLFVLFIFFARQSQNDLWLLRFSRKILLSTAWAAPLLRLLLLRRRQRHVKSFKVVKKNTKKYRKKQQIENFIINEFRGGIEGPLRVIMRGQCGVYATRMKISAVEPRKGCIDPCAACCGCGCCCLLWLLYSFCRCRRRRSRQSPSTSSAFDVTAGAARGPKKKNTV